MRAPVLTTRHRFFFSLFRISPSGSDKQAPCKSASRISPIVFNCTRIPNSRRHSFHTHASRTRRSSTKARRITHLPKHESAEVTTSSWRRIPSTDAPRPGIVTGIISALQYRSWHAADNQKGPPNSALCIVYSEQRLLIFSQNLPQSTE